MLRRVRFAGVVGVLILLALPASGSAATVQNTHDMGLGSLRQAIADASDGDTIQVPKGLYRLTSGELSTDKSLTIAGAGARKTVIDGNHSSRVFETTSTASLSLSDLTIRNGNSTGSDGGGMQVGGALTLVRTAVRGNSTGSTPGSEGNGGGFYVFGALVVRRSLIADNHAYVGGAANANSTITLVDSTITGNSAGSETPGDNGVSGAIESSDKPSPVRNSTIAFNSCFNAPGCGGAFYNGDFTFRGSIIAENFGYLDNGMAPGSAGNPGTQDNCGYVDPVRFISAGHNLEGGNDCGLQQPTDKHRKPRLGHLKNNGGPTDTLALQSNSPALNAAASVCGATDQRGAPRSLGGPCDIGAYERVFCGDRLVNRVGTSRHDVIRGTRKGDGMLGLGGPDRLLGGRGNDALCGGSGADSLFGGPGDDLLLGGPGTDGLHGGPGNNTLRQ